MVWFGLFLLGSKTFWTARSIWLFSHLFSLLVCLQFAEQFSSLTMLILTGFMKLGCFATFKFVCILSTSFQLIQGMVQWVMYARYEQMSRTYMNIHEPRGHAAAAFVDFKQNRHRGIGLIGYSRVISMLISILIASFHEILFQSNMVMSVTVWFQNQMDFNLENQHRRTSCVETAMLRIICRIQSRFLKIDVVEQSLSISLSKWHLVQRRLY
jgi:hypothetical protein